MIGYKSHSINGRLASLIGITAIFLFGQAAAASLQPQAGDANVILGDNDGTYELTWTAPGDDDNIGIADHYILRYSIEPIDESNWAIARDVSSPPAPLEAGNPQSFTVTGLICGGFYYFAIKTVDDAGNISDLSNVASGYASGILMPIPHGVEIDTVGGSAVVSAQTVSSHLSVYYEFALDTTLEFSGPAIEVCLLSDSLASVTYVGLSSSYQYYWRCRAMASDRSDSSHWSESRSFNLSSNDIMPPEVMTLSPNGRERWDALSTHPIFWSQSDDHGVSDYRLDYSTDGGNEWLQACDWTAGVPDSFAWTLPDIPTRRGRIKVSCRDGAGNVGDDVSDSNFIIRDIARPHVHVVFPNGGDSLGVGDETAIVWEATDNVAIDSFMLEYSVDGAEWSTIVPWTGGNPGSYSWHVPGDIAGPCLLRASCIDPDSNMSCDTSDAAFYVFDYMAPQVTITSPTAGDTIQGEAIIVSWLASDNDTVSHYIVYYSIDGGTSWIPALEDAGGDSGHIVLQNPGLTGECGLKVTCFDRAENAGTDSVLFLLVSVHGGDNPLPTEYSLSQGYPNPFNPTTSIRYSLPQASRVRLEVYDLLGHRVATLVDREMPAGYFEETWDAGGLSSGTYIYRIEAGQYSQTQKTTLLK